jgi:hypothetical protein
MRYFDLLDFQYVVLALFIGIAVTILLYVAFGWSAASLKRKKVPEEFAEGLQIEKNPVPPILIFIYTAFFIWALVFMIVEGIKGGPF